MLAAFFFTRLAFEVWEGEADVIDQSVSALVQGWRGGFLDEPMLWATRLGGEVILTLVAIVIAALIFLRGRPREGRFFALSMGGAVAVNAGLKLLFHRARPDPAHLYLVTLSHTGSFPSGHAMASMALVASLLIVAHARSVKPVWQTLGWTLGIAIVATVALSRVFLGAHYPSDVLGGISGAGAWVAMVTGWFYPGLAAGEGVPRAKA
jgi:membrane-associated phospholipid phosphatase